MEINYTSVSCTSASVKLSLQSGAGASSSRHAAAAEEPAQDAAVYVPGRDAAADAGMVEKMKASLNSAQSRLFDLVNDLLSKQGRKVQLGQGSWRILSEGDFQVDAQTKAAAQQAISEDGEWGVRKTSERLVNFAKALAGGDKSKIEAMRDAFLKGYEAAEKAWGGCLPEISRQTRDAALKLFDEWAEEEDAGVQDGGETHGGFELSASFEYSRVSSSSVSISGSGADAEELEKAGLLSDVSDPLRLNGITLKSEWCMNERVSVSVSLRGWSGERRPAEAGRDGFEPRRQEDFGGYGRGGKRPERSRREGPAWDHELELTFFKPMSLESGKQQKTLRAGGREIPLHEDGTVTVGFPDGTLRHAKVSQEALDRLTRGKQA